MKKLIIALLLAFVTADNIFSQPSPPTVDLVGILQDQISSLGEKVVVAEAKLNSISNESIQSHYQILFQEWANIQTAFISLLSAIGIIFPLLTYLFGYKPAKDAERELERIRLNIEETINSRIGEYLVKKDEADIRISIENSMSPDPSEKSRAATYLGLNQYAKIDSKLRENIVAILKRPDVDANTASILLGVLFNEKSSIADSYFIDVLLNTNDLTPYVFQLAKYYSIAKDKAKTDAINRHTFDVTTRRIHFVLAFCSMLLYADRTSFLVFINEELVLSKLRPEELEQLKTHLVGTIVAYKVRPEEVLVLNREES